MSVTVFLLTAGFWILHLIPDRILSFGFSCLYAAYLQVRIRKYLVSIIWILIGCITMARSAIPEQPETGLYAITQVRNGYSIASDGKSFILYRDDRAVIHDNVRITDVEPIESLKNIGVFNFADSMEKQGILYQGKGQIVSASLSLQARIMRSCQNSAPRYSAFYGIREGDSLIGKAGLPVLAFMITAEKFMRRWFSQKKAGLIMIGFALVWGHLFLWPVSLTRWLLFRFFRLVQRDRLCAWSLSVSAFLILMPEQAGNLSLVMPALLQLAGIFRSKYLKYLLPILLQALYFQSVSPISLFGWPVLKGFSCLTFLLAFADISIDPKITVPEIPVLVGFIPLMTLCIAMIRSLKRKGGKWIAAGLALVILGRKTDPFFHVWMLDVGQGDCTVIEEPFAKSVIMIDAAGSLYRDNAESVILPFLKSRGIDKLDLLILTHEDYDHDGAADKVLEAVSADYVIRRPEQSLPTRYPLELLLPERSGSDENENSLITYIAYDGFTWLWMGDAGKETEDLLMKTYQEIPVTILKAGHHGSDTASSFAFLDWIRPDLCLISAGRHNRYGHPSPSVISNLQTLNISRFSTAESGMIHTFSWRGLLFLETAEGEIALVRNDIISS